METNVRYEIVGTFVIILIAIISFAIIWLSSAYTFEGFVTYKVYMQESVSGLSPDAPVEYNGVNVGTVASIKINRKNPRLVELLLKIKNNTPITYGTRAKLEVKVLTGIATIALEDKGTDMTPLQALPGQEYPVIATAPSFFLRLDTVITQLNNSFRELSGSIHSLLDEQNLKAIKQSLENIRKVTGILAVDSQQMDNILHGTSRSMQIFERQTLPDMNELISNLNSAARNVGDLSNDIKHNPAVLIRGKTPQPLGPGEK